MNRNSKNVVRLTESKLRNMIKEAIVNLTESPDNGFDIQSTLVDISVQLQRALKSMNLSNNAFHRIGDKWNEFEDFIRYEINRRK